jgi:endonuclease/exonuclease/phosphatase family metal-dependent hydrolase
LKNKLFVLLFSFLSFALHADEFKLLSWNIFMIPKPVNFSKQLNRATGIGKKIKQLDYDVIVMQEAFSKAARKRIYSHLKKQYPYQHYFTIKKGAKALPIMPAGLWIVSRQPIKKLGHQVFNTCATSDCLAAKAVVLYEVKFKNKKIQLANTHLQAWNTPKAKLARKNQLKQINQFLASHRHHGTAQVIAGDLNVDYYDREEYSMMLDLFNVIKPPLLGTLQFTNGFRLECFKAPSADPQGEWLDHIFIKENHSKSYIESTEILSFKGNIKNKTCDLSDHYAITALIKL